MSERQLVTACRLCRIVKRTSPHICTQRTGVRLFSYVEYYLAYLRMNKAERHVQLFAKPCHRIIVIRHTVETGVNRDSRYVIIKLRKPSHLRKSGKQNKAVLAAGYSHCDFVALLYKVEILYCFSYISQYLLHYFLSFLFLPNLK